MAIIFGSLPVILQNGTLADANQVMADFNKIISDGNANAAENGINASITALTGLNTPIPIAGGSSTHFIGPTSGGTAAAQTVASTTPSNWALTTGFELTFNAGFNSVAGGTTLAVNGGAALAVRKPSQNGPVALAANDWVNGQSVTVVYDGTAYLMSNAPGIPAFGVLTALASAATTDLGTIPSHNVQVTGTTTITSFGSSASTSNPYYMIVFTGILTLTYNATSLIIPGTANLTTAANDWCIAEFLGSGNWQIVSYNKANGQAVASAAGTAGVLVGVQAFTVSGTYTPNALATKALAFVTGAGGGGGSAVASASNGAGGGGGGAGGTTIAYISSLSTLTVTINAAGGAGGSGGSASLGTITANGGSAGGNSNSSGAVTGSGGSGGTAGSGGTVMIPGGDGAPGLAGSITGLSGGSGGASFWGGGGAGAAKGGNGNVGSVYGSGGGGGAQSGSTSTNNGSGGAGGFVLVLEFK